MIPILKEERLKPFHPLVESIPQLVENKEIACLRDIEKTLLWLAPVSDLPLGSFIFFFFSNMAFRGIAYIFLFSLS